MLPGVPVHLVHRGNNRQACFFADNDRGFYLHHLRRLVGETPVELHAFCLMTNHVHLLLTAPELDGCARLMQRLAQSVGIAMGAYFLQVASVAHGHAQVMASDFPPAFIALALVALGAPLLHRRLGRDAGVDVSGHRGR